MTTIFLNLGPRRTGGELLPDAPFRAFVKFETAYDEKGGCAVLKLKMNDREVGTATIDWPQAEARRRPGGRKYWVADGSLDEVEVPEWTIDEISKKLVIAAMVEAKWEVYVNDHALLHAREDSESLFETWILTKLN